MHSCVSCRAFAAEEYGSLCQVLSVVGGVVSCGLCKWLVVASSPNCLGDNRNLSDGTVVVVLLTISYDCCSTAGSMPCRFEWSTVLFCLGVSTTIALWGRIIQDWCLSWVHSVSSNGRSVKLEWFVIRLTGIKRLIIRMGSIVT